MQQKINIHETAFVTAAFRAGNSDLSRDVYAHLWANEITDRHAEHYCASVSRHEAVAHCLRNRYFFDTMQKLIENQEIDTLINFGCGFSMYPYLLPQSLLYVEIDTRDVVLYKQERTMFWEREGILPRRNVRFLEADFNAPSLDDLYRRLRPMLKDRKAFILLEGVLFFLGHQDTDRLFDLFARLMRKGEIAGSVSFRPELEKKAVFQKLIDFVEGNLEKNQQFNYQTLSDVYYLELPGFKLLDHQDTLSLATSYMQGSPLPEEEVLNEHMYLLRKQ